VDAAQPGGVLRPRRAGKCRSERGSRGGLGIASSRSAVAPFCSGGSSTTSES
jgi:hypothetical protein